MSRPVCPWLKLIGGGGGAENITLTSNYYTISNDKIYNKKNYYTNSNDNIDDNNDYDNNKTKKNVIKVVEESYVFCLTF